MPNGSTLLAVFLKCFFNFLPLLPYLVWLQSSYHWTYTASTSIMEHTNIGNAARPHMLCNIPLLEGNSTRDCVFHSTIMELLSGRCSSARLSQMVSKVDFPYISSNMGPELDPMLNLDLLPSHTK